MHIDPKRYGLVGDTPRSTPAVRPAEAGAVSSAPDGADRPSSRDSVQISDAGRALASGGGSGAIDQARAAQIRAQVLAGAYDSLEAVDAIARRLIESGDL
jgi:anti-sigma28 factor (negative regulator of flagellin synthesis)